MCTWAAIQNKRPFLCEIFADGESLVNWSLDSQVAERIGGLRACPDTGIT